jgi:hypothetical protein
LRETIARRLKGRPRLLRLLDPVDQPAHSRLRSDVLDAHAKASSQQDGPGADYTSPGTTKDMEGRVFYLTAELKKLLSDQRKAANRVQRRKGRIVPHVFFHDGTTKAGDVAFLAGHAISGSGFYHAWCRARIKAGCPGSIPQDFRRTAIRNMVRAGVPSASP